MKSNLTKLYNITVANKLKPMNNNLAKLFRIVNNQSSSTGFTLIELLIAASLTTVVTCLAGSGMVAMTENNKKAQAETERRVELNRALDFISDEARQAKFVAKNASATLGIVAPTFSDTGRTPVLTLQIPGVAERVIYYIAPKPANNSPWLGPNIIYRWGPNLNEDGKYTNATTPGSWTYEPLADLIIDTALTTNPCPDIVPGTNTALDWTLTTTVASAKGFYACVDPDGRIAQTHLRGRLRDAYGGDRTSFDVTTKAFARSFELAAAEGADALAAAETAANALAAAIEAARIAAAAAQTAVDNLGTLQGTANDAAADLITATTAATDAAAEAIRLAGIAATTPTADNYNAAAQAYTDLAIAERAAATAATAAATAATAATALQIAVAQTAADNATKQQAVVTAAATAQTTAASAGQGSTEQAATTYATTALTTATNAVSSYTTTATAAATTATAAATAVTQNADIIRDAPGVVTTNGSDATAADTRADELTALAQELIDAQRFTTSNGTVTFTQNSSVNIQVLGGDITCGADGAVIPTTTTPNVTSGGVTTSTTLTSTTRSLDVPAGSTLTLTGAAPRTGVCSFFGGSSYNSATNSAATNVQQVLALRNGDTPPIFSPFGNQRATIESFLTNYINPATGRVTINANQVIYLFELGAAYNAITRSPAYDMQDLVVLATVGATTLSVATAPTITGTINSSTNVATLSWSGVTDAAAYELYKCIVAKAGSCTPTTLVGEVSSGVTQDISGIGSTNKVLFAVKAKNSLGTSALSNMLSFETTVPVAPFITPNVSGNTGNKRVTLSWSAVPNATAYELYQSAVVNKTATNCTPATLVNNNVSSGVETPSVNSAANDKKICFAVRAKNSAGTSDRSNIRSFNRQGEQ